MKTKWFFLCVLALNSFAFTSCSDDDDDDGIRVSEELNLALRTKYPNAANVEWEAKAGFYVADFRDNGTELEKKVLQYAVQLEGSQLMLYGR